MKIIEKDNVAEKHSPIKLLLILIFAILICDNLVGYLFAVFLAEPVTKIVFFESVMLVLILSPIIHVFLYRPLSSQFDKLKKSEVIQKELALIDSLTGLYNRRGILSYANHLLKLSKRRNKELLIIYIDLDGMKYINDHFGHEEGDNALIFLSKVLRETFRISDVIGRIGGDEFTVISLEADAEDSDVLRNRLKQNLKAAVKNATFDYKLTVSIGIVYCNPNQDQKVEELLNIADRLMYEDKNSK